jgi:DNA-binding NtrC family response regulator
MNKANVKGFTKEAIQKLESNEWKGNVRELENALERAVVLSSSELIQSEDLPSEENPFSPPPPSERELLEMSFHQEKPVTLEELSKKYIQYIFDKNEGAKEQTAKDLGIDRKTLYRKLKDMNLN